MLEAVEACALKFIEEMKYHTVNNNAHLYTLEADRRK